MHYSLVLQVLLCNNDGLRKGIDDELFLSRSHCQEVGLLIRISAHDPLLEDTARQVCVQHVATELLSSYSILQPTRSYILWADARGRTMLSAK